MGATEVLSTFIAEAKYEDLPVEVVQAAKIGIMDGVANMLAGSAQPLSTIISDYVRGLGGASQCTVIGCGFKSNPPSAAFASGVFGHCLDFEIQGFPPTHGTSSCLPAALALAETTNAPGRTVVQAYVLGWEVQGRLRAATAAATNPAFHPPGLIGPFGSAAACSVMLALDSHQTRTALGMAASRAGGLTANTGTMVKSTHPGNAARMGVEAAMLAQAGYTGNEDILETPTGFADAFFGGTVDWETITDGLGATYRLVDPGFDIKRFPAQIHMQRSIEAVINLRQSNDLQSDMVEALEIQTSDRGHSGPIPRSGLDGKFSIAYCAAAALLDGDVGIDTFTDKRRFAGDMEYALPRVTVVPTQDVAGARATATLKDGRTLSEHCLDFRGSAANPMSRDERVAKFEGCARRVLSARPTEQLLDLLERLEEVDDISEIMSIMAQRNVG